MARRTEGDERRVGGNREDGEHHDRPAERGKRWDAVLFHRLDPAVREDQNGQKIDEHLR